MSYYSRHQRKVDGGTEMESKRPVSSILKFQFHGLPNSNSVIKIGIGIYSNYTNSGIDHSPGEIYYRFGDDSNTINKTTTIAHCVVII